MVNNIFVNFAIHIFICFREKFYYAKARNVQVMF